MGRWFVWAHIPTYFDRGTINNVEDYCYDFQNKRVLVHFTCFNAKTKQSTILEQRAQMANAQNSVWRLALKFRALHIPIPTRYVIMHVDQDYAHTIIGVPDRSLLYIMARSKDIDQAKLRDLLNIAEQQGYELKNIQYPRFDALIPDPAPFSPFH